MRDRVTVIAEVGSNYNGDLALATRYVHAAKECGADAVKFQTLHKEKLVAPRLYSDGAVTDNPAYLNFASLELPDEWHYELKGLADEIGIEFMSTPFYLGAVDLLESVGVHTYKIASGDITFGPLLDKVGRTGKRVVLSTGASTEEEISAALQVLKKAGTKDISLLHCVSNYPPVWDEMNVRAVATMRARFRCPVGISDHTPGSVVPLAAVALGGTVIEKHVTFDRANKGPDHPFAMTVEEFAGMVEQVRLLERVLGDGRKRPSDSELAKQNRMRRGIYDPVTLEPSKGASGVWLRPDHQHSRHD